MNLEHEEKTMTTKAYAAIAADSPLAPFSLTRRSLATMKAVDPLPAPEPGRGRMELPEMLPLSIVKARRR